MVHALRLNASRTNRANDAKTILNTITLACSILSLVPGLQILGVAATVAMTAGGVDSAVIGSSNIAQTSKGSSARKSAIEETVIGAATAVAGAGLSYYSGMGLLKGTKAVDGAAKPTAIRPSSAPISLTSKIISTAPAVANVGLGVRGVYVMGKSIYDQEKYGGGFKGLKSESWNEQLSFANDMLTGVLGIQGLAMQGAMTYKSYKISSQATTVKTDDLILDKGTPEESVGYAGFKQQDISQPTTTNPMMEGKGGETAVQFENPAFQGGEGGGETFMNPMMEGAQYVPSSSIIGIQQQQISISLISIGVARVFTGH